MTLNSIMVDIASAIREKTGKEDKIAPVNFAEEIKGISVGGNSNDNLEYLDVNGLYDKYGESLINVLAQVSIYNKGFYYSEYDDAYEYQIGSTNVLGYWGSDTIAVALDLSMLMFYIYDGDFEGAEPVNFEVSTKDYIIMSLENSGYDNAEELLNSIPRITKEKFFAIPEKPKKPLDGAWIQHVDGTLYTGDQWTAGGFSNDEANGVAVIRDKYGISFVVAKESLGSMAWSSMPDTLIEGVPSFNVPSYTLDWYKENKGKVYTEAIAAVDPNSAAAACVNYTFPNGQKGYLMAFGEAYSIYNGNVYNLMSLIGATFTKNSEYWWTSSQKDTTNAFVVRVAGMHDQYSTSKSDKYEVTPICTLENYTFAE